jgi:hypothetical protein
MKILTKKQTERLFDDLMTINLIGGESVKEQTIGSERPDIRDLILRQRILIERTADAVYLLKGMFGMRLACEIQNQWNAAKLKQLEDEEAKNDELGKVETT